MRLTRRDMVLGAAGTAALAAAPAWAKAPIAGVQANAIYRYRVGEVEVTAISDGVAFRDVDGFVKNADLAEVRAVLAAEFLPTDKFPVGFTTLALNTGSKLILIDTGNGEFALPTSGTWMTNFRAAGFQPDDVDLVIHSHFHPDHINGTRRKDGSVTFRNAEVMVPAPEWAFWMDDAAMARAPEPMKPAFAGVRRVFAPIAKDVTQYEWGKEIAPGLTSIAAPGHTPGHTAYVLASGNASLLIMSDVTNHPGLFAKRPEWTVMFDMDGPAATITRKRLLDMAASERAQVAFYHAPFPATGHIVRDGAGYALLPVEWSSI